MKFSTMNIFAAWFFMVQTVAMGWVAAVGRMVLELLGANTVEGDIPGRLVGALLLFAAVYLVQYFLHELPPQGKQGGNGYALGHKLILVGNLMAGSLFLFHFFAPAIKDGDTHLVLDKFTTSFGVMCMALLAIGFSLVYQSAMQTEKNT